MPSIAILKIALMAHSPLYCTLLNAFEKGTWAYTEVVGREVIRAGFEAHHARVDLHVQVFDTLSAISVVSESPRKSPSPIHRERIAELAMRVNETLTVGNFEIQWDTGQLFFRATNLFATPQGDIRIIQGLVHTAIGEMDRIAPIEAILLSATGPELAAIHIPDLLQRIDLLPEIPSPSTLN